MSATWKIEREDYDFSRVPKVELEACYLYEFARESRAVRRMVAQIRRLPKVKPGAHNVINVAATMLQNQFLLLMSLASEFPALPWEEISGTSKQLLLELPEKISITRAHLKRVADPSPPLVFNFDPAITTLASAICGYQRQFPAVSNDPVKFGFIAINLKFNDEDVFIEAFTRNLKSWLRREPDRGWRILQKVTAGERKPKSPGRHSFRDPLNALGALRLRAICTSFREAKKKMQSLQKNDNRLSYSDRRDFNFACERGLQHFQELSHLFGNSASELPIHYTKGWKR